MRLYTPLSLALIAIPLVFSCQAKEPMPSLRSGVYVEESEPCDEIPVNALSVFSDGISVWTSKTDCKVGSISVTDKAVTIKESCVYLDGGEKINATIRMPDKSDPDRLEASFIDDNDFKKYRFCPGLKQ